MGPVGRQARVLLAEQVPLVLIGAPQQLLWGGGFGLVFVWGGALRLAEQLPVFVGAPQQLLRGFGLGRGVGMEERRGRWGEVVSGDQVGILHIFCIGCIR